jgi:exodeoxyribonuclease V gamma subunit
MGERPPGSCDQRLLEARQLLDQAGALEAPLPLAALEAPAAPDPDIDDDPYSDLRDWLLAPQASWLNGLGLRPREWADSLDDLEALSLDERGRAALLRQALDNPAGAPLEDPATWLARLRGQAQLPPLAAGELEAGGLSQRWRSLQASLNDLGPERRVLAAWQGWQQELVWRGSALLLLHTARPRNRHRLELWVALLLAAAAGQAPSSAVLVARGDKDFGVQLRLAAPDPGHAREELQRLAELRQRWRQRCWPVPPETGWVLLEKGEARAIETWEGTALLRGERQDPEQALCFGAELAGSALLASGEVAAQAEQLLVTLREHLR